MIIYLFVFLIPLLAAATFLSFLLSVLGAAVLPSSWKNAIICGSGYHMVSYRTISGGSPSTSDQCVSGNNSYFVNFFLVYGLKVLVGFLVLCGVVAAIVLIRRLRRRSKLGIVWPCVLIGALGCLALIAADAIHGVGISASSTSTTDSSTSSSTTSVPRGHYLELGDNYSDKTVACNDGYLKVDGRSMTVTVTGHCGALTVGGETNHVTVDAADAIAVDGTNNVVIFHSGAPQIDNSPLGQHNLVRQG